MAPVPAFESDPSTCTFCPTSAEVGYITKLAVGLGHDIVPILNDFDAVSSFKQSFIIFRLIT